MTEPEFIEAERLKFEAAWMRLKKFTQLHRDAKFPGDYVGHTQAAWEGWLARARENTVTEDMVERVARMQHQDAYEFMILNGGSYPTWEMIGAEDREELYAPIRAILTAALQPGDKS